MGRFYVGGQDGGWLPRATGPLILSRSRLARRVAPLAPAVHPWFLDSGAFRELTDHGEWTVAPRDWAGAAVRWGAEAGLLEAVGVQDWVCTPRALAKTGRTVVEHQAATVRSLLELRDMAPSVPWVPTLQGWTVDNYVQHAEMYAGAGVDLASSQLVGVGSIAQRQETFTASRVFQRLHDELGLVNLHAFGAKLQGLARWGWAVHSADSMAWSLDARRMGYACGRHPGDCRNCQWWAHSWGAKVAQLVGGVRGRQLELDGTQ